MKIPTRRIGLGTLITVVIVMVVTAFDLLATTVGPMGERFERWLAVIVAGGLIIGWIMDERTSERGKHLAKFAVGALVFVAVFVALMILV